MHTCCKCGVNTSLEGGTGEGELLTAIICFCGVADGPGAPANICPASLEALERPELFTPQEPLGPQAV